MVIIKRSRVKHDESYHRNIKIFHDLYVCFYTYECFAAFRQKIKPEQREHILSRQCAAIFLIHFDAFAVIYLVTEDISMLIFYAAQAVLLAMIQTCYQLFYSRSSRLLTNNLCMLLTIGFIMLTRLSFDSARKQYFIALVSMIFSLIIPVLINRVGFVRKLYWLFAIVGILALLVVTIAGNTSYGAKISLSIAGISIQPSEFVKILFVFFVAGMLYQDTSFQRVCVTTVIAAIHVLILVASRDLGAALLFFVTYVVMLYVATKKLLYFAGGLAAGSAASVVAYHLFSHIRVRVRAWQNPLAYIDKEGYQISQSLFAIGTGGWFGMGLYQGLPDKIPVVKQDFIFSAVSEELGGIFALCLIMVCFSCFLMFLNIAMQMKDQFYKLVALGLGTIYAFQVFLTIGGVTKFIPSTGDASTCELRRKFPVKFYDHFAVIQGLYILRQDEGEINASKSRKNRQNRKRQPDSKTQTSKTLVKQPGIYGHYLCSSCTFVCMMGYFAYFQFVKVKILSIVLIIKDRIFCKEGDARRNYFCRWPHTRRNDHRYGWDRDKILSVCQYVCACRWFLYQRKVRTGIDC